MTKDEACELGTDVRRSHGYCLDQADVLTKFLAKHPHIPPEEGRSLISMAHGVPFPSIRGKKEGPFPVYPDRPYYDARFHEGDEPAPGYHVE